MWAPAAQNVVRCCVGHHVFPRNQPCLFNTFVPRERAGALSLMFGCAYPLQVIRLRKKLSSAADAVKGLFGVGKSNDEVVEKLEKMQVGFQVVNRQHSNCAVCFSTVRPTHPWL